MRLHQLLSTYVAIDIRWPFSLLPLSECGRLQSTKLFLTYLFPNTSTNNTLKMGFGDEIKDVENAVDGQEYVALLQSLGFMMRVASANTRFLLPYSASQQQTSNSNDSKYDTVADSGKLLCNLD